MSLIKRAITNARGEDAEKALSPAVAGAAGSHNGSPTILPNPSSPDTQAGGYGEAFNPLPRDASFQSLFGPGNPFRPDPLDTLDGISGRSQPRRYQYRVTENLNLLDRAVPWTVLRQISSDVDVVSRCLELVQDAISGMEWSWGFSRQIINQIRLENNEPNSAKATAIARDKYGEELTRVQKFWERPDERMGYTFSQWLTLAVWAQQVYDGIVVYPSYTLGGDLHSLSILDTSTIKILLDNQGFIPQPPNPAYQQILYGFPRGEFQAEDVDNLGNIPHGYKNDQLAYFVRRPRLHTVYGFSVVEECINYATLYQQRQEWMHAEWSHGVVPKMVIETTGTEGWTPEQFAYFQNNLNDQWSGQTQRRQQAMVLRPGMKPTQLKDFAELFNTNLDEWLVMQIGAKFGVPQQQLGIPLHSMGRSGAQNVTSMDLTDKFALDSLVNYMVNCINDLTRRFMGVGPEITITATTGNSDQSDYQRAQADASDVNNAIRTTNEIRAERGLPLMSDQEADVLRATAGNAVIFFPGQLAYQEATEQAVLNGILQSADPDVSTPSQPSQEKSPIASSAAPAPKSKSNTAETSNRSVGHVTSGSDMVTPGTDRKAHAARREPNAPQPTGDRGSYTEKELAQFAKFSKARQAKGTWRDFEFTHVDEETAALLNDAGRASVVKTVGPAASGVCVRAASTDRILMLQRSVEDDNDAAAGKWEFPGGRIEDGETPYEAACREWTEETGCPLPDGTVVTDWLSPNGVYKLYVMEVRNEADVAINLSQDAGRAFNPDDPDADCPEVAAWFNVSDLPGNSALRAEVALTDWNLIAGATASKAVVLAPRPDTTESAIEKLGAIIRDGLRGDIAEFRLDLEKSKQSPTIHIDNHIPEQPTPVVHVDATSHHDHHVQIDAPVDATSIHHVAAPEVHVDATSTHNVEAPNVTVKAAKAPNVQVDVHTQAARSKVTRAEDGSVTIERDNGE